MEKKYKLLIVFFSLITLVSLAGFFKSYLSHMPDVARFPLLIHLHFTVFTCWLLLIIVQPLLIRQKRLSLHRKLGKLSYFLAPLLVITILLLVREKVLREYPISAQAAEMEGFIGLLDAVSFSVYYLIAMIYRRNLRWHVAFIIGASLIVLNPGMARLLNNLQPGLGLLGAVLVPFLVPIAVLTVEKIKYKRPILKSPYFLFLLCWIFEIILLMTVPASEFWKSLVRQFAG